VHEYIFLSQKGGEKKRKKKERKREKKKEKDKYPKCFFHVGSVFQ
jgi:hypothetical protein